MTKNYEINFTKGGYIIPLLSFAIPLLLSNMLQLAYNAADIIVVGQFAGNEALAAVGSTSSLIHFFTNIFLGLSVGSNVLISNAFGMGDKKLLSRAVHTALSISVISGILFGFLGFVLAEKILLIMQTPDNVIDKAVLYMRIYCVGLPVLSIYNFGSSILRAVGDTKRPLYFLIFSGLVNIILNLVFVVGFGMDVDGVAYATIISEAISAALILICLIRTKEEYRFEIKKLAIHKKEFLSILKVGIPAGIQGSLFSFSNIIIQSNINSFGSTVMAANSASSNVENFVYSAMNSMHYAAITFSAQNLSVNNINRIKKGFRYSLLLVSAIWIVTAGIVFILLHPILSLFSKDAEVISYASVRLIIMIVTYILCGFMDVISGTLRGLSYSTLPMIVSLIGVCGFRIAWIYVMFSFDRSLHMLYLAWPFSWAVTTLVLYVSYKVIITKKSHALMPSEH